VKFLFLLFFCSYVFAGVKVDKDVERFMTVYCEYWSDGDYNRIISEIYDTPFTLYKQDNTKVMKTKAEVEKFLLEVFKSLEEENYSHSIINRWESYKKDRDIIIIEMNFTRFLKDGKVMGDNERTASYIIRKKEKGFKILAIIPHTAVAK
jgi:hypothetical protein